MITVTGKEKSWNFIKEICDHCEKCNIDFPGEKFNNYHRSPMVESEYKQWKEENHDLISILFSDNQFITIRLNDFPYHFEVGLIHYVVWLNPNYFNESEITPRMTKIVKEYVSRFFKNSVWVYFRNEPNYRTINYIPHYHVIIKTK